MPTLLQRAAPISPMWNGFDPYLMGGIHNPRQLGSLEAWYDSLDTTTLLNNAGTPPVATDGIKLWADKSGNSGVNCLCLNGVAGNYASAPNAAALQITGDIDIRAQLSLDSWTPAANAYAVSKFTSAQSGYALAVGTTGLLVLFISTTGADAPFAQSSVAVSFAAFSTNWIRATRAQVGGVVTFYTSQDGITWTQLGTTATLSSGSAIFAGTSVVTFGAVNAATAPLSGRLSRAQIYNGIAGTLVFDANFTAVAKLATSFTESSSNAATVTINTSGDIGTRICGERDLVQMTAANQAIYTPGTLTFDGSNDYLKAAAFLLAQPCTVYFVGSQVTWTGDELFYDGAAQIMRLQQRTTTPSLAIYGGSSPVALNAGLALATNGIITAVFRGAASSLRINRGAATTGSAGTDTPNGFTLGASSAGATPANITVKGVLIYSAAHSTVTQDRIAQYLGRYYSIPGI